MPSQSRISAHWSTRSGGLAGQEIYGIGEVFWLARLQRSVVDHDGS